MSPVGQAPVLRAPFYGPVLARSAGYIIGSVTRTLAEDGFTSPNDPGRAARLRALRKLRVLDTPREAAFDDITALCARLFHAPMSTVTFVDAHRQWFKSSVGIDIDETDLGSSICAHAVLQNEPLIIPDTRLDPRCETNPSVTGALNVRWYAGVPLRLDTGENVGTLTVMDHEPRDFSAAQVELLSALARSVVTQLQLRLQQHALQELTSHYVEAQRIAGVGSWKLDLATNRLQWSDEIYRMFGVGQNEFKGTFEDFLSYVHPDDRDAMRGAQVAATLGNALLDFQHRIVRPDGTIRVVHERGRLLADAALHETSLAGTVQDVTEQHEAQQRLRSQQAKYQLLFDSHPQPMWVYDEETLQFLAVNEAAVQRYGWSREEFARMTILDIRDVEDRAALMQRVADTTLGPRRSGYWRHLTKDTGEIWVEISSTRLEYEGRPARVVVASDVTAKRLAERSLQRADSLRRVASRAAGLGGWAMDLHARNVRLSEEACRLLDAPEHFEIALQACLELVVPESRDLLSALVAQLIREGTPFDTECELFSLTGRRFWARIIAEAERDAQGAIIQIGGGVQDISDRRKLEQQFLRAQRLESIGTLAGGIAHDLNNVLTPILMSIELLREPLTDAERDATLDSLQNTALRGADMVSQVLSFARGVEGRRVSLGANLLLAELTRLVADTFPRSIVVETEVAPDTPAMIGDPTQLHQVLLNLAVNARDAMPNGGLLRFAAQRLVVDSLSGATSPELPVGVYVVLSVEDTGTGIPADQLTRIFDPFFTTKEIGQGTGLGLSTSLTIVRSHGGALHVYSEPGRGTTFRAFLPASTEALVAADRVPKAELPRGHGELVLVVDDEAAVREITRLTLEAFGYRVLAAADGAEGVALYAAHVADVALVLTDMMMPVMDGVTMIHVIRRLNPNVRIVAASGLAADGSVSRAANAGVQHFLPKPYTAETLLTVLHTVLQNVREPHTT